MIRFTCECGKQLQAKEDYAGQRTRCPDCGREMAIPGASTAIQATAPVAAGEERPRSRLPDDDYDDMEPQRRPQGRSGKALASLILGLLLPCNILTGLPAIILGIWALMDINKSRGRLTGQGLAIGGLVTGGISILLVGPVALLALLLPAVQKVREAANRQACANNLKQIGLAIHNYNDTYGKLPPAVVYDAQGKPLYSWRVLLLPYLEHDHLYKAIKLDEPWDSAHNKLLLQNMPKVFLDPSRGDVQPGTTTYVAFRGKGTMFESDPQNGLIPLAGTQNLFQAKPALRIPNDIPDGLSNTIMVVESDQAVPWSAPQDLDYFPDRPLPKLGGMHAGGFNVLFGDGSVRFLQSSTAETTLRALITRNGGEVIPPF